MHPLFATDPAILAVDDDPIFLDHLVRILQEAGYSEVHTCSKSTCILKKLDSQNFSVILCDVHMPDLSGPELLEQILQKSPNVPVIMLSGDNDVSSVVRCIQQGAFNYLEKPVLPERLFATIHNALHTTELQNENAILRKGLLGASPVRTAPFSKILTNDPNMVAIFKYIEAIAQTNMPVLITGETGTGKELFAQAIHLSSNRKGKFIALNVAGVDSALFSDMLFGHERGAFTNADKSRAGLIEQAQGGTLFLDEIGDLSPDLQVRLLRLLQEKQYYPIGSDSLKTCDARILVATHQNLPERVAQGLFRRDLFYRLQFHQVDIPPLRKRKGDIPLLASSFIEEAANALGKISPAVPMQISDILTAYHFPGNIRELQAMAFEAMSRHEGGTLSLAVFKERIGSAANISLHQVPETNPSKHSANGIQIPEKMPTLEEVEEILIQESLRRANGNQGTAAALLGISRRALNNRLVRSRVF